MKCVEEPDPDVLMSCRAVDRSRYVREMVVTISKRKWELYAALQANRATQTYAQPPPSREN